MFFGIINVNKPKGLTSHQVVAKLRKILGTKQIGHTGTLDPMATGVLPVCIGKATRIIEFMSNEKAYRAFILLGVETDTYDMEGQILSKTDLIPDKEQVIEALKNFTGEIEQTPPMYSAVHYQGKRLYEYARKNIEISDIPVRKVTINDIKLVSMEGSLAIVDIDCSGGTYIRSIAHDLGAMLGCGACLENLTRIKSGIFTLENTVTLEEIENNPPEKFIIPPQQVLNLEIVEINQEQTQEIARGRYIWGSRAFEENTLVQLVFENTLVAIARTEGQKLLPDKVFVAGV